MTLSVWSHLGKIRYQAWDVEANVQANFTDYKPASAGTSHAAAMTMLELIPGTEYSLQYRLDCIPDITGYTEGWVGTGIGWTAPESGSVVYYFSQP
jgi:pyruvate/oxaloacetate carboxyltransferase